MRPPCCGPKPTSKRAARGARALGIDAVVDAPDVSRNLVVEETFSGPAIQRDEEMLLRATEMSGTCFHSAGTARMGVDDAAVTDLRLRACGLEGLRVADTSIMLALVSGDTNGPAMVIGLRAADFILEDRYVD